jgi:transcription initiation factor TFIID subunit 13
MPSFYKRSHRPRAFRLSLARPAAPPTPTATPAATTAPPPPVVAPSQQKPRFTAPFPRTVVNPGHVPGLLAPPWPFNPQDTTLIRAGYKPQFNPSKTTDNPSGERTPTSITTPEVNSKGKRKMAEPRARAARHKGQMNFASECVFSANQSSSYLASYASRN